MKKKISGILLLLVATIIWGSAFASQSLAMDHLGPFSFQAIRCTIAVIGLLPLIAISDKIKHSGKTFWKNWADKKLWIAGVLCGIPLFLACNLQQLGLASDTDPGKSGFLTAMYVVIVPIIGIFRKKRPTIMVPISVALAVVGLYFLSCVGVSSITAGDLLTLGCALMFAVQITFVDIFANSIDTFRLNAIQALICSIFSGIIAVSSEKISLDGITGCIIPLIHVGFFSMGLGYAFQIIGQKNTDPTLASLIMSLESVFAVIFGWIFCTFGWLEGDGSLSKNEWIGCVLVFAAVILSQIPIRIKKKSKQ